MSSYISLRTSMLGRPNIKFSKLLLDVYNNHTRALPRRFSCCNTFDNLKTSPSKMIFLNPISVAKIEASNAPKDSRIPREEWD